MAFTPSAGLNCVVALNTSGSPALAGMNWTLDVDPHPKDVSNFATGRMRIGTLLDATLTFQLVWDTTAQAATSTLPLTGTGSLWAGNYVTVYCFTSVASPTRYFTIQGIISKVTPSIASIEDAMLYNVEVSLSQTATSVTFTNQPQFSYPGV
jgi:hypothetical protein